MNLSLEFGGKVDVKAILDFIDNGGGNLILAASPNIGDAIRELGMLAFEKIIANFSIED